MENEKSSLSETFFKVQRASISEPNEITMSNVSVILKQRRIIAIKMLEGQPENVYNQYLEHYNYLNELLKTLLAI